MKVLLADGCTTSRMGSRDLFQAVGEAEVVGEADSAEQVVPLASEVHPDLIVVDPRFGGLSELGEEAGLIEELKALPDPQCVVIYAEHDSPAEVAALMQVGADHYVHKSTTRERLRESWERIRAGESVWILAADPELSAHRLTSATQAAARLTSRQLEVLILLLKRLTDEEIAGKLYLGKQTVKNHNRDIFRAFEVKSRQELYARFRV